MSAVKKVLNFLSRKKTNAELIKVDRKSLTIEDEGYVRVPKPKEKLELLYYTDPVTFALVNKLAHRIIGMGFEFEALDDESKELEEALNKWAKSPEISLTSKLVDLVRNAIIFGDAYAEIVLNKAQDEIVDIAVLDPKRIDFIREDTGEIKLDDWGRPVGYTQEIGFNEKIEIPRERILHIFLIPRPDGLAGISLVEMIFKVAVLRLNVEEAIGESAFRYSFPLIIGKYGDESNPPTRESIKAFFDALSNINTASVIALPYYAEIKRLDPTTGMRDLREDAEYLLNIQCAGFMTPRALLLPTPQINYAGLMAQEQDFSKDIEAVRSTIAGKLIGELVVAFKKVYGLTGSVKVTWKEISDNIKLATARRLSTYARYGLLTPDLETENAIRRRESLPLKKKEDYQTGDGENG